MTDNDKQRYKSALSSVRGDISRARAKLPWERPQGGTQAAKGGPPASGNSEATMDRKDAASHEDLEGDSVADAQNYERKMQGSTSARSAHLVEGSETSRMRKNDVSEGNEDYVGSMERKGRDSDDPSDAMRGGESGQGYKGNRNDNEPGYHDKKLAPHKMGKKPF